MVDKIWEIPYLLESVHLRFLVPKGSKIWWTKLENATFLRGTISKVSSTQRVQNSFKIVLSVTIIEIKDIFDFCQNSRLRMKFKKFKFSEALSQRSLVP